MKRKSSKETEHLTRKEKGDEGFTVRITSHVNGLNSLIKRQRLAGFYTFQSMPSARDSLEDPNTQTGHLTPYAKTSSKRTQL